MATLQFDPIQLDGIDEKNNRAVSEGTGSRDRRSHRYGNVRLELQLRPAG